MEATNRSSVRSAVILAALAALGSLPVSCSRPAPTPAPTLSPSSFAEPADAVRAFDALIGQGDTKGCDALFGPDSQDMLASGDPIADAADGAKVKALIAEGVAFEDVDETTKVALLGPDAWPFPIPLVKDGETWRFDSAKGREEIANRRVGRNELLTLATLHALVDAQREYAAESRDGRPAQYARRFLSTEGQHDGLYWPTAAGEPESPLGDLVAEAADEGYAASGDAPKAYHGYRFRLLEAQGGSSPGGAHGYVNDAGDLTRGFACVAWPAKHGMSGVMTFLVRHTGIVYEKDLGPDTEKTVAAITTFDPDETWTPTWMPDDI